jgi:hypothetical protein
MVTDIVPSHLALVVLHPGTGPNAVQAAAAVSSILANSPRPAVQKSLDVWKRRGQGTDSCVKVFSLPLVVPLGSAPRSTRKIWIPHGKGRVEC